MRAASCRLEKLTTACFSALSVAVSGVSLPSAVGAVSGEGSSLPDSSFSGTGPEGEKGE